MYDIQQKPPAGLTLETLQLPGIDCNNSATKTLCGHTDFIILINLRKQ